MAGNVVTHGIVRTGLAAGVASFALLAVGGCLIPFTAGVSVVVMIPALLGWPYAALVGWRGIKALPPEDPVRPWAQASLLVGASGLLLLAGTLGLLALSILGGVVLAELVPDLGHHHWGH